MSRRHSFGMRQYSILALMMITSQKAIQPPQTMTVMISLVVKRILPTRNYSRV